ncbi:translation initiation factor IF-2-like [Peromyscus leucopus]|uniref:translation initiation factor IF-2-like n=1 Tax=Peromyscus leucopus TaxID=10041 RepID=UPI0010A16FBF|nr:translation initiation factor IF-2-like [Peromyscus leucopus]
MGRGTKLEIFGAQAVFPAGGRCDRQDQLDRPPASGRRTTGSLGWRTLRSAPNGSQLPLSAISLLSSQRAGTEQTVATCSQIPGRCFLAPGRGRQANGKRAEVHTPTPKPLSAWVPRGSSTAEGTDAPRPAACSPTAPAPPPILPAPQRPPTRAREWEGAAWAAGATGVGAALLALAGSGRLGRFPLTCAEASPRPRAPRVRGSCGRGPPRRRAPSSAGKRPAAAARAAPPRRRSLARPSLTREVKLVAAQASRLTLDCQLRVSKLERSQRGQTAFTFTEEPLSSRSERGHDQTARICSSPLPRVSRIKTEDLGM